MIKYKARVNARYCEAEIESVEVEKETEKSVWINGRRESKNTLYGTFFDTWEQAHRELYLKQKRNVENIKNSLDDAEKRLSEIMAMKKDVNSAECDLQNENSTVEWNDEPEINVSVKQKEPE